MDERFAKGLKFVLKQVTAVGVTMIVSGLAGSAASNANAKGVKKACYTLAGIVLGGMLAKATDSYLDTTVDEAVTATNALMGSIQKAAEATTEAEA